MEISQELINARNWCLGILEDMNVEVVLGQGIFYHPPTPVWRARLGCDVDPECPSFEYSNLIHEFAHYLEGYSHRHELNWGLEPDASLGDWTPQAYYRETVVDAIVHMIWEKFQIPQPQVIA